jgi:PRTRC genetic system protein B
MDLHLSPLEPDVQARLLFLRSDELLFQWNDETNNLQSKLIAHQDARIAFAKMEDDTGWLPDGVVRAGRNSRGAWVVYIARPQIMSISTDQKESLSIPIPMSLFIGWGHRYYLFALRGKVFDMNGAVYRAPYPNVYDNGRICWGSHKVPVVSPNNIGQTWQFFFATTFNEHIASGKTRTHADNALDLLRELSVARRKTFPVRELVKQTHSVNACIDSLLRRTQD